MPRTSPSGASPPRHAEDAALLARLRAGEALAFEELVRANTARLLATAKRIVRNDEDAHDIVQDAFASAFRSLARFEGNSSLATWLCRIAINAGLMKLRSRRSRPETPLAELLPHFSDDGHREEPEAAWTAAPDARLLGDEDRTLVRDAIARLPDTHRIVLVLRDIEERSTGETANLLGITENAVKIRLHRARQALRTLLDRHYQDAPR